MSSESINICNTSVFIDDDGITNSSISSKIFQNRSSKDQLKANACDMEMNKLKKLCDPCSCSNDCTSRIMLREFYELKSDFWGGYTDAAPTDTERRMKLQDFFSKKARKDDANNISFLVGNSWVCENSFLRLLGMMTGKDNNNAPSMFRRLKKEYIDPEWAENRNLLQESVSCYNFIYIILYL